MVSSSNRGAIIKIYSEPGEGTTVKIYLPRLDAAPDIQSESAQDETPLDAAESGESILVVEDDYLLRSYMVETLRDLGYHVIAAADATGALGFLDHPAIRIDMMLTDVVMRGMNCAPARPQDPVHDRLLPQCRGASGAGRQGCRPASEADHPGAAFYSHP